MRLLTVLLVAVGFLSLSGCVCLGDNPNARFWWNSHLVPTSPDARVDSGTGATDNAHKP